MRAFTGTHAIDGTQFLHKQWSNGKKWEQQKILVTLIITLIKFICTAFFMCRLLMIWWCHRRCCCYCKMAMSFMKRMWEVKTKQWKIDVYIVSLSLSLFHSSSFIYLNDNTHSEFALVAEKRQRQRWENWQNHDTHTLMHYKCTRCVCMCVRKISRKKNKSQRCDKSIKYEMKCIQENLQYLLYYTLCDTAK